MIGLGASVVKRTGLKIFSILVGIGIALLCFEVGATAWLTLRDGKYTSAAKLFTQNTNTFVEAAARESGCRYGDTLFPHPYLAFVHSKGQPCSLRNINNIGLFGEDFPDQRRTDRFVVLLTGGSVAAQLGQMYPKPAPRYLEDELNRNYVSPNGKPFLVLNGGDGAWKQPQQTILFSIYANFVDAVVTLDGYNEQLMIQPGVVSRFELPGNNFLDANPIAAQDGFGKVVVSWMAGRVAAWIQSSVLENSHGAYLLVEGLSQLTTKTDPRTAKLFWEMMKLPQDIYDDPNKLMAHQIEQYRKYIRIMDMTARHYNVKSMFFLQPVPAVDKPLTEEEKRATPDMTYGKRYVGIVRDLETLNEGGIAVRSLLDIYAGEKETIYADSIHAYQAPDGESRGYRIMAARMAREMAEGWDLKAKAKQ